MTQLPNVKIGTTKIKVSYVKGTSLLRSESEITPITVKHLWLTLYQFYKMSVPLTFIHMLFHAHALSCVLYFFPCFSLISPKFLWCHSQNTRNWVFHTCYRMYICLFLSQLFLNSVLFVEWTSDDILQHSRKVVVCWVKPKIFFARLTGTSGRWIWCQFKKKKN